MKVVFFDTHAFERGYFEKASVTTPHELHFLDVRLEPSTVALLDAVPGVRCVCAFTNDRLDATVLGLLKKKGIELIALRSAGFNHVDLTEAGRLGLRVVRVPAYSPYAVAEYAMALILCLNRKIHRAYNRVREGNFSLDGLVGFDLHGKSIGIVGTGKIGSVMCKILGGFGCQVLAHDAQPSAQLTRDYGVEYVPASELYRRSDVLSMHVPLSAQTRHFIDEKAFRQMKPGAMLINTGRGALIDTGALIAALKSGQLGSAGLDVYEEEEAYFFQDLSDQVLRDDVLARLLTFPNVVLTSHQAFLTREALVAIATTTLGNISEYEQCRPLSHEVRSRSESA